ncbi:MAG: cyclic peptide export ABC transporter [bacterium]|nr:cyclic peptide export ABC transporter [bacterium]
MKVRTLLYFSIFILFFSGILPVLPLAGEEKPGAASFEEIGKKVQELMEEGDIPGLTLVMVKGDGQPYIKSFGYADIEKKTSVTPDTFFELCSTSKAFTGLAVLKLERDGLVDLDAHVSKYLEGFHFTFEGEKYEITLRQLLHHTTGVATQKSIYLIPVSDADDALQQTARNLSGFELARKPGVQFEYATTHYGILGAVIEKVSGMSYEDYMSKHVLGPLGLTRTLVGANKGNPLKATGYRIGFFSAREYDAPVYRGNNPAGYIVSNGNDMARWLQLQMGLLDAGDMGPLISKSHQPDLSVLPYGPSVSYAMGWMIHQFDEPFIEHGGLNPNFTAQVNFSPEKKLGLVVLANSNSAFTAFIARGVMEQLKGKPFPDDYLPENKLDQVASMISLGLAIFLLVIFVYLLSIVLDLIKGRRRYESFTFKKLAKALITLVFLLPFVRGIQILPVALSNMGWDTAAVWTPISFQAAALLVLGCLGLGYLGYFFSTFFPMKNKYMRSLPMVVLLSLLSGMANAVVILLITSALFSDIKLIHQTFFYALAFFIYIVGRKVVQTRLTEITFQIVYDLRMRLVRKVFLTSYQNFEKMQRGRVFATLNDDTGQIAATAGVLVGLITSTITSVCAFIYLATIAFWATALTLGVVIAIAALYGFASGKARRLFEEARDTRNVYMGLLNGLLDGFKELSLRLKKKVQYENDVEKTSNEFMDKMSRASIRFINAFLVGESMLLLVLGAVSFAIPRLFPDISDFVLMSFIMVLLYLIGPVNGILNSIPALTQIRVAWGRVKSFEKEIPATIDPQHMISPPAKREQKVVERLIARDIEFSYKPENEDEAPFTVGPLDFEAKKGEITFIIGGNGSGKTTLAKLLTGLYKPEKGVIQIDGKDVEGEDVGESFSTVFAGYHLFKKLYDVDLTPKEKQEEAKQYLDLLHLQDKVAVEGDSFTTVDLSGGQRKRLALMQCYLENSPIYLFDEVAADQDPEFRKFFYRDLLTRMKEEGKIVIAITHDDHYFDVADKIIKMDMGKIDTVDASYRTTSA